MCGLSLPGLFQARGASSRLGRAKSCIVLFQQGGPSHHDTFDVKPDAPAEVRGEFRPIATSVTGYRVCEHLPRTARQAHRFAVVRSVHHDDPKHNNAGYQTLTGTKPALLPNTVEALASPRNDLRSRLGKGRRPGIGIPTRSLIRDREPGGCGPSIA